MTKLQVERLLKRKRGILLDVSYGGVPQPNSVVLTRDLSHNPGKLPWPLPDRSVHTAIVTHVLEYMNPGDWFRWWNELHRVMRVGGIVYCSGPYGGDDSGGWLSDPTHRVRVLETSFVWLDPRTDYYKLNPDLGRKPPKPWHVVSMARVPSVNGGPISYNVTLASQAVARA